MIQSLHRLDSIVAATLFSSQVSRVFQRYRPKAVIRRDSAEGPFTDQKGDIRA
jgi:hypothetical protein